MKLKLNYVCAAPIAKLDDDNCNSLSDDIIMLTLNHVQHRVPKRRLLKLESIIMLRAHIT